MRIVFVAGRVPQGVDLSLQPARGRVVKRGDVSQGIGDGDGPAVIGVSRHRLLRIDDSGQQAGGGVLVACGRPGGVGLGGESPRLVVGALLDVAGVAGPAHEVSPGVVLELHRVAQVVGDLREPTFRIIGELVAGPGRAADAVGTALGVVAERGLEVGPDPDLRHAPLGIVLRGRFEPLLSHHVRRDGIGPVIQKLHGRLIGTGDGTETHLVVIHKAGFLTGRAGYLFDAPDMIQLHRYFTPGWVGDVDPPVHGVEPGGRDGTVGGHVTDGMGLVVVLETFGGTVAPRPRQHPAPLVIGDANRSEL